MPLPTLRKQELTAGKLSAQKDLRQLNQNLANLAGNTAEDSGQRAERIRAVEEASRAAERRIEEIVQEQRHLEQEPLEPDQLRRIVGDFENVWASLTVREQEQLVKLLVAKVVYDGTTGKVTIGFRSEGARELCQGRNR